MLIAPYSGMRSVLNVNIIATHLEVYIRIHSMLACRAYLSSNNAESLNLNFSAFLSISVPSALMTIIM
jgi:hypothetical protein